MSALPKQVIQQQQELDELEKQLYAPAEAEPVTETPPAEAVVAPVEEKPTAQPEPVVESKPLDESKWEQKYRTLQGMFDREVPELHRQNKELVGQLQQLQEQMKALQAKPEPTQPKTSLVTAEEEETYSDLIDIQRRVVKEALQEFSAPLKSELSARDAKIAELEKALNKTGGDVATMSFEQKLALAIPDFTAINADPQWIGWLDEADPYTGNPRRAYAEYVYNNGDVEALKKVVAFYKASTQQQQPDAERQKRQIELERQVTPNRSSAPSSPTPANDRIYTEAEVSRLFDKVRTMNMAGKYDEANKLEAELSSAYMQGRVRG
jgi:hypothetical protein